jgi:hypothetical protein
MQVRSFVEHGANLGHYHTYAWGPAMARSTGDPRLDNNAFFDRRVREAIERELPERGLTRATAGTGDLLVRYHASVSQRIDLGDTERQYAYRGVDSRAFVYDAGTLVVDLVDPRTNTLVWRGWAEGSFEGAIDNQQWMESRIDDAVARILRTLPREPARSSRPPNGR